jgi:hypothetical protein
MGETFYDRETDRIIFFDNFVWGTPKILEIPTRIEGLRERYRGNRIRANAPEPGMLFIGQIAIDGEDILVEAIDAFMFAPTTFIGTVEIPTINPNSTIEVEVTYSGILPPQYVHNQKYDWVLAICR